MVNGKKLNTPTPTPLPRGELKTVRVRVREKVKGTHPYTPPRRGIKTVNSDE